MFKEIKVDFFFQWAGNKRLTKWSGKFNKELNKNEIPPYLVLKKSQFQVEMWK